MPTNYILKNSPFDQKKIDRLVRTIEKQVKSDRDLAKELLAECKDRLYNNDDGTPLSVEGFAKILQSSIASLNQMGRANELLLKLASMLQKPQTAGKGGKKETDAGSLFATLSQMADKEKSDGEEKS